MPEWFFLLDFSSESFSSIMLENGGVLCWSFILEFLNSLEFFVYIEASLFTYSLLLLGNRAIAHFRCLALTRSSAAWSPWSLESWTTGPRSSCPTGKRLPQPSASVSSSWDFQWPHKWVNSEVSIQSANHMSIKNECYVRDELIGLRYEKHPECPLMTGWNVHFPTDGLLLGFRTVAFVDLLLRDGRHLMVLRG